MVERTRNVLIRDFNLASPETPSKIAIDEKAGKNGKPGFFQREQGAADADFDFAMDGEAECNMAVKQSLLSPLQENAKKMAASFHSA